ncbi:oligosaccharide flippase family protein [Brevibacillus ginsengisoli]|uniref:oligosaccharide flippase family protein n=1 Tax=Brevibacillus ginsengisoli TaxID=363854 RepID=UPI003CE6CDAF
MKLPAFIKQTALRTGAIFLVKAIGLLVRIPLFRILGSEGTGIYQIVYSIFGFALTLLTGGFPTSLALMTAKDQKRGLQFFKGMVLPFFILGAVAGLLCYAIAPYLAHYLGNNNLTFPISCLAPALLIVPLLQLFRGFLQGIEFYGYVSASELIEQVVRAGTMLVLAVVWMKYGIHAAAGGAAFGAFTGACIALCFLLLIPYGQKSMPLITSNRTSPKKLIPWMMLGPGIFFFMKSSLAITLTRLIAPASDLLDVFIIPNRLQASGLSQSDSIAIFGEISGMAAVIVYLPTILTAALSYTMASKLTASWENQKREEFIERSNLSLEIGWFWGISSSVFLIFYADEISKLVFGNEAAAEAIRYMSFAPLIAGMRELTTTILWAIDQKRAPLTGLLLGLIGSAIAAYYLTAIPGFGYAGAALSILVFEILPLLWNSVALQKECKGAFPVADLLSGSIFLVVIALFYLPFDTFLLYIAKESANIRSLGGMLFFIGCIALYVFLRFRKKMGRSRYR